MFDGFFVFCYNLFNGAKSNRKKRGNKKMTKETNNYFTFKKIIKEYDERLERITELKRCVNSMLRNETDLRIYVNDVNGVEWEMYEIPEKIKQKVIDLLNNEYAKLIKDFESKTQALELIDLSFLQ